MNKASILLAGCLFLPACSPMRRLGTQAERHPALRSAQTGICIWDAESGRELYQYRAGKLFTPASNAKILTLAACLEVLKDSIPRFGYHLLDITDIGQEWEDQLFVCGTGDPTTLHPSFAAWQFDPEFSLGILQFFTNPPGANTVLPYGPGWAWDDFGRPFSAEISPFPVYGNQVYITRNPCGKDEIYPPEWAKFLKNSFVQHRVRDPLGPDILDPMYQYPGQPDYGETQSFPVYRVGESAHTLLPHVTKSLNPLLDQEGQLDETGMEITEKWYACPTDTVLRFMMHRSDNFTAEQLLLVCAVERYGGVFADSLRAWAKDSLLGLGNGCRWVDGSGLSRYNLISPRLLCQTLYTLWQKEDHEFLLGLFPEGGKEGTLTGWFGDTPIWAKSGSMSGVYCLSGYWKDPKGRMRIFSIMVNGFTGGQKPVKEALGSILRQMR